MAGVSWSGGTTPEKFAAALNSRMGELVEQVRNLAVTESGKGADMMQHTILSATTPTGEERAKNGGVPGRYETGNMYNEVDSVIIDDSDTRITAEFGWLDPQKYFEYQEDGTSSIEPMHALNQAANQVFDEVEAGLVKIVKEF